MDKGQNTLRKEIKNDSDSFVKSIFRAVPIGIGVVIDRKISFVNQQFCEMVGYSEEELVDQSARMVYPSDEEYERVGKYKYEQIQERGVGSIETVFIRKDGQLINILLSSSAIEGNDISKGVTFSATNITEHKQEEKKLKEKEKKYRVYIENAPVGVFIADTSGKYTDVNQEACRMTGYSREELLKMSIPQLSAPNAPPETLESFSELKKTGKKKQK